MKIVPAFKMLNMRHALTHYMEVLDFQMKHPDVGSDGFVDVVREGAEIAINDLRKLHAGRFRRLRDG